jgi:hypothetical protein
VLAIDVLLLSLLAGPLRRRLAGELRAEHSGLVLRRWPLFALNLLLLAGAFLLIEFAFSAVPDTRALAWNRVAERAFTGVADAAVCPVTGWLGGALAAVQDLSRHAAQLVIPQLPDLGLKLAAWAVVLARAGLLAWLVTTFLLGVMALRERLPGATDAEGRAGAATGAGGTASLAFVYTILILAVPYLYATAKLKTFDPSGLAGQAQQAVAWANPCRLDPAHAELTAGIGGELGAARRQAVTAAEARIDAGLEAVCQPLEQGVDAYLDWYFTVVAEYQRLTAAAVGDFGGLLTTRIDRHLLDDTGFADGVEALNRAVAAGSDAVLDKAADRLGSRLQAAADPCAVDAVALALPELDATLDRDRLQATTAAGAGAATAVTVKLLASKTGAAVAAKLAGKKSFQTAAALGSKLAAKKGGSALLSALGGAAVCAPSGPWALLCGIGAGAATWLAVDKVLVEIDEARLRADMRADLLEALEQQRDTLAMALKARESARIEARALAIQRQLGRKFLPLRDGL